MTNAIPIPRPCPVCGRAPRLNNAGISWSKITAYLTCFGDGLQQAHQHGWGRGETSQEAKAEAVRVWNEEDCTWPRR